MALKGKNRPQIGVRFANHIYGKEQVYKDYINNSQNPTVKTNNPIGK